MQTDQMLGPGLHGSQIQRVPNLPDQPRIMCYGRAAGHKAKDIAPLPGRKPRVEIIWHLRASDD